MNWDITKEEFESYLKVQASGKYDMWDDRAMKKTKLGPATYILIIRTYGELKSKYKDLWDKYMGKKEITK